MLPEIQAGTEIVNQVIQPQRLSLIRRYAVELLCLLLVIFCIGCICAYLGKSSAFQDYLITNGMKQSDVINNNTRVVEENTATMKKNNELLQRRIEQTDAQSGTTRYNSTNNNNP